MIKQGDEVQAAQQLGHCHKVILSWGDKAQGYQK